MLLSIRIGVFFFSFLIPFLHFSAIAGPYCRWQEGRRENERTLPERISPGKGSAGGGTPSIHGSKLIYT